MKVFFDTCVYAAEALLGAGAEEMLARLARQRVAQRAMLVSPPLSRHAVVDDPADSPILQAALAAGDDYLVTNDAHLLGLNPYEG